MAAIYPPIFLLLICLFNTNKALASQGDRSEFYQNCVAKCNRLNCTNDGEKYNASAKTKQPLINKLLLWSCDEECRYECMWTTAHGRERVGWHPVKFHGKWPFKRVLGMQEWGSVLGSILNLATQLLMLSRLNVSYSRHNTPLLWLWNMFSVVCINGWVWSTIFHARDTPLTEFMDYACALSMIVALFITCEVRLLYGKSRLLTAVLTAVSIGYYVNHVIYLGSDYIDYEYNIMVNIVPGALSVVLWTFWALSRMRRHRYVWRILLFNLLSGSFLLLELFDFPPYRYTWDAHALWHVCTSVLPLVLYGFVRDDLHYLRQSWPDTVVKSGTKLC